MGKTERLFVVCTAAIVSAQMYSLYMIKKQADLMQAMGQLILLKADMDLQEFVDEEFDNMTEGLDLGDG